MKQAAIPATAKAFYRLLSGRIMPVAIGLVLLLVSPQFAPAAISTFSSSNWAGYVVQYTGTGSTAQTGVANYVSATWTVPRATASLSPAASGSLCECTTWVGLDGFDNSTVEQVGTRCDYIGPTTLYDAWYEMYPGGPVHVFNVQPGDSITASVQYDPPGNPGTFLLSLTDNTQNLSFPPLYETNASAQRSSAEWIAEATQGFKGINPLPTVGNINFTGATATLGTESAPIDNPDWETWQIMMNPSTKSFPAYTNAMTPTLPVDSGSTSSFTEVQQTPEPSSMALLAAIATGLAAALARRS